MKAQYQASKMNGTLLWVVYFQDTFLSKNLCTLSLSILMFFVTEVGLCLFRAAQQMEKGN